MANGALLRILIANERKDRLERVAEIVTGLGHEVISSELEVSEVAAATVVKEATCPVIALLESGDATWVNEAAKRGIFDYIVDGNPSEMQSAIDITIRR